MPESLLPDDYPCSLSSWKALKAHRDEAKGLSLEDLFAADDNRFQRYSVEACGLFLDYSKNLIADETRRLLLQLAKEARVAEAAQAMFAGEPINSTENRSVLHVALRAQQEDSVAPGIKGVSDVPQVLERMQAFVDAVQSGQARGGTGGSLKNIVNIGIGGSDLGPVMASRALRTYWQAGMRFFSVSNVDGTQLADLKHELDPAETLFVICSKTFTTQETMTNAHAARAWIVDRLGEDAVAAHFAAASTNHAAMDEFGIDPERRFGFWDWVGGRYSLWSAVGLSLALVIGMDHFRSVLAGGRCMDRHFLESPPEANAPLLLALLSIWYNNFLDADTQAILPYDNRLDRFPAYLQQLQMESSGKGVRRDGRRVSVNTGMIIFGEAGSNAQHSFYQLLHQGTRVVPIDFLLPLRTSGDSQAQHDLAIANCLAQSEALMGGQGDDDPHRVHIGNRPSTTVMFEALDPHTLGQLIALYEHKVFVENVVWGTNAFDQFGVELGKKMARRLEDPIATGASYAGGNASTAGLLERAGRRKRD